MEWLLEPQAWIAFLTLTVLELVLGIDNVIFISILAGKLPDDQQKNARTLGLMLAFAGHARQHQACAISLEFFGHPKVPAALRRAGFLSKNDIAPVVLQCRADTPTLTPERNFTFGSCNVTPSKLLALTSAI